MEGGTSGKVIGSLIANGIKQDSAVNSRQE